MALGLFGVVGEVGDDADEVVGGGGLGGGDGAVDGAPLVLALGAVAGGPGGGQGGGDVGGGVLVVVGDGLVGVGGSGVGGGCGGAVSPAPGVGDGGELHLDGGVQDGGGLVAYGGVGVDDEGLGDDDLGAWGLAGDARALSDEGCGLAGGDRDRTRTTTAGGLGRLGGVGARRVVTLVLDPPVLVLLRHALVLRLLIPHRWVRRGHGRMLLRRRFARIWRSSFSNLLAYFSSNYRSVVLVFSCVASFASSWQSYAVAAKQYECRNDCG